MAVYLSRYKIVECSFVESLTKYVPIYKKYSGITLRANVCFRLKASIDDYERSLASINALDEQSVGFYHACNMEN